MRVANLVGERFKETPSDCVIDSHIFMLRGGYMKYVAGGIFSQFPQLRRITRKIEQIAREEMDAIDGQEVLFPVVLPGSLWEESGRFQSVGAELMRMTDRNGAPMVLGMTHEEAAVQLVREFGQSYQKYPFMIYQIQTKFRDEARPRGGLIRVREFTMKDGYSFHTSQEDLDAYYQRCHRAYERIYARAGLPGVVSVASDSGMMGGSLSHEFMYLTPVGEDSIAICSACGYRANVEAAPNLLPERDIQPTQALALTETPGAHTIEDLCAFLKITPEKTCKAVAYQKESDDQLVILFLRGDMEVNETKLTNLLGDDVYPAKLEESAFTAGFLGPVGLPEGAIVLYDESLKGEADLVCGGNTVDFHYTGFCPARDVNVAEYHDLCKIVEGGVCPQCGKPEITISRGVEVGNIFQLGDKYTKSMNMQYLDQDGQAHYPIMGCYGIGVGRLAASVVEEYHDEYGPIWPMSIAPWQVQICAVRADQESVRAAAEGLYDTLTKSGVEVLYDDRPVRAGVMFSDADLFGVPVRVVVSPRNLGEGVLEMAARDKSWQEKVPVEQAVAFIRGKIDEALKALNDV